MFDVSEQTFFHCHNSAHRKGLKWPELAREDTDGLRRRVVRPRGKRRDDDDGRCGACASLNEPPPPRHRRAASAPETRSGKEARGAVGWWCHEMCRRPCTAAPLRRWVPQAEPF
jgi:hypothetical protein